MRKAGYKNLYWLSGGFDAADDGVRSSHSLFPDQIV
jgi:hypothetical protein